MTDPLKKHLTTQLELLDDSSCHLQSSICDFVQQIKTRAIGYLDKISDTNMKMNDLLILVTKAQSTIMEHTYMLMESTKMYPPTVIIKEQTTPDSKCLKDRNESISKETTLELTERLKDIETTLASLQDSKQKSENDLSEIKQWKDDFVTEQSAMMIKIDKFSKKQKQDFKNLRKQLNEENNKMDVLSKIIEKLEEKESTTNNELGKISLDLKEHENILNKINKATQEYTDKAENLSQEIRSHSGLIATIQEDGKKNIMYTTKTCEKLISKHAVLCKLLQQRLLSMDKLIETYNRSSESREGTLMKNETLGKDVLKLSLDRQAIANYQKEISTPWFSASQGHHWWYPYDPSNKTNYKFTFKSVEHNIGNHFDRKTGEFTAPVDGIYTASLTVRQKGYHTLNASFLLKSGGEVSTPGVIETRLDNRDYSTKIEVCMKSGDVLSAISSSTRCECTHFSCALLAV